MEKKYCGDSYFVFVKLKYDTLLSPFISAIGTYWQTRHEMQATCSDKSNNFLFSPPPFPLFVSTRLHAAVYIPMQQISGDFQKRPSFEKHW